MQFYSKHHVETNDYAMGVADPSPVGSNITTLGTHTFTAHVHIFLQSVSTHDVIAHMQSIT